MMMMITYNGITKWNIIIPTTLLHTYNINNDKKFCHVATNMNFDNTFIFTTCTSISTTIKSPKNRNKVKGDFHIHIIEV